MAGSVDALLKALEELLADAEALEEMMRVGFGDKACKRQVTKFVTKARMLHGIISNAPDTDKIRAEAIVDQPIIVLGADGEQRMASAEELEELKAIGAPIGMQDNVSFRDDFGDDESEVI